MVGKVPMSNMRSEECKIDYNYTGPNGNLMHVNTSVVKKLAAELAAKSSVRLDAMDATTKSQYEELMQLVDRFKNHPGSYEPIYHAIMGEFAAVTVITPGTIGEAIKGGSGSNGSCGRPECDPVFIRSKLKNPEFMNRTCDGSIIEVNNAGVINVVSHNNTSSTANVFLESTSTKLNSEQLRQIKNMGITNIQAYTRDTSGNCVPLYDNKVINIDTIIVDNGKSTTVVGGYFNTNRFSNGLGCNSNNWWWWLIGLLFIILVIVIIILIIWLVVRAIRSSKRVEEAESCGMIQKCVNMVKDKCRREC